MCKKSIQLYNVEAIIEAEDYANCYVWADNMKRICGKPVPYRILSVAKKRMKNGYIYLTWSNYEWDEDNLLANWIKENAGKSFSIVAEEVTDNE